MGLRESLIEEASWKQTENGADALKSTGSKLLDYYGLAGALRGRETEDITLLWQRAYNENADYAMKLLFYTRDIREGLGERDTFRKLIKFAANKYTDSVIKNLTSIIEFGRADDLYELIGTKAEDAMWKVMKITFNDDMSKMDKGEQCSLLAKWIATPDSKSENTRELGKLTAKKLGYKSSEVYTFKRELRALRKYLNIIEPHMCNKEWDKIEYSKVPSRAMLQYRKAFNRNDGERFQEFISKVEKGEEKINTSAVTPCDIIKKVYGGEDSAELNVMWNNLPDYVDGNALVMCDTSGSMHTNGTDDMKSYIVANALALYFAERNKGDLKNLFMTFTSQASIVEVEGDTLMEKLKNINKAPWGNSTNLEAAFKLLLQIAVNDKLPAEEMPKAIVVISDMEIDSCAHGYDRKTGRMTFTDSMKELYASRGYELPGIVYWNVNARNNTFHAKKDTYGVQMASGYSAVVFKDIMKNVNSTPYDSMMDVLSSERYAEIVA